VSNYPDNFSDARFEERWGDEPESSADDEAALIADEIKAIHKAAAKIAAILRREGELDIRCGGGFTADERFGAKVEWLQDVLTEAVADAASKTMALRIYKVLEASNG
jgi:hypothetical protein